MTTSTAQPETVHGHGEDPFACPVFRLLPDQLQEESRSRPFLWDYLHTLAVDEIGVPEYAETLENAHRDLSRPNLVFWPPCVGRRLLGRPLEARRESLRNKHLFRI